MKLIYCPNCHDLFKLDVLKSRYCKCKRCAGMYTDDLHAVITTDAIAIGISNPSFQSAVYNEDVFAGWVFGKHHPPVHIVTISMKRLKEMEKEIKLASIR